MPLPRLIQRSTAKLFVWEGIPENFWCGCAARFFKSWLQDLKTPVLTPQYSSSFSVLLLSLQASWIQFRFQIWYG